MRLPGSGRRRGARPRRRARSAAAGALTADEGALAGAARAGHDDQGPPGDLVRRLELARKLAGHDGCVNTAAFTPSGDGLLSGSDDRQVVLWRWDAGQQAVSFDSGHTNNVFQARAMPFSGDRTIVTCAADGQAYPASPSLTARRLMRMQVRCAVLSDKGGAETRRLARHRGRAHKLALDPGSASTFFSTGEDGVIRHFDLRDPSESRKVLTCRLLRAGGGGGGALAKRERALGLNAIIINPRKPHHFAVGGSDEYARVYDIRKPPPSRDLDNPMDTFAPAHLRESQARVHITCVAYSQQGELLASYNDELIYMFQPCHGLGPSPSRPDPTESKSGGAAQAQQPQVFEGHRNSATVKGVSFFGLDSEYVVSGSDCGRIFMWKKVDGELVALLKGDAHVVNCLEPHPSAMVLATSGIDSDVKIWMPTAEAPRSLPPNITKVVEDNRRARRAELFTRSTDATPDFIRHLLRSRHRLLQELDEEDIGGGDAGTHRSTSEPEGSGRSDGGRRARNSGVVVVAGNSGQQPAGGDGATRRRARQAGSGGEEDNRRQPRNCQVS
eukprot:SM000012S25335  [mRNA]  locus=s12:455999:459391:+ [translate_table: standard]